MKGLGQSGLHTMVGKTRSNQFPVHYQYIDALRGWAILAVIMVHVSQQFPGLAYPVRQFANEGARGVQLFFVVSALTLTMSWHERPDGTLPFYTRRLFRIAPMFWLAILFFLGLDGFAPRPFAPEGISWIQVFLTTLFLHGWHPISINSVVPGGWSIAVEMTFYVVFPILVLICRSTPIIIAALFLSLVFNEVASAVVSPFVLREMPNGPQWIVDSFKFLWFLNQLPIFLIGVAVYFLIKDYGSRISVYWANTGVYSSVFVLIILPFVNLPFNLPGHVRYGLCFGLLAFCLACGANTPITNKIVSFIGKVSFSCYLWHFVILDILADHLPAFGINPFGLHDSSNGLSAFLWFLVVMTLATVALSSITYRYVEEPMIKIGSKIARRLRHVAPLPVN
jgi:peptidoglycan/LPS O-acetylase OafA/YrhL